MDIKDIDNLAELSRLELTDMEKGALLHDLDSILGYVRQIESVQGVEGKLEHTLYNVWREDMVESREFSPEIIRKQFPSSQDGFLKVKKIL